jgi:hypothetical protein
LGLDLDLAHGRVSYATVLAASGGIDLDAYRGEADRFVAALDEEFYLHYAGLKPELELAPIYERYADLASLDACTRLGRLAAGGGRSERTLWRFACEGYLGDVTRDDDEEVARLESTLVARVGEREIGYRMIRPTIANEPNRDERAALEGARVDLAEAHLLPVQRRIATQVRDAVADLGADTYLALYRDFGLHLDELANRCRSFLALTEARYVELIDPLFRERAGVGLDGARRWDVARLFRASEWDSAFPAAAMLPALEATLGELGIDLSRQANVHIDVEQRPSKSPRAFCAPVEVPGRVVLVIQPIGGADDWIALFHEAGHMEHFAHTSATLPVEARRLGDNSVTEGWAALFERLISDPVWLGRRLDFGRPDDFARETAARTMYLARRYCAKLLYELELHAELDLSDAPARYVELLGDATKIEPAAVDFLADVDAGFYAYCYLRSWAFEAQLREFLRGRFGRAWFARPEAGALLRELWYEGQGMDADELLDQVADEALDFASVADRIEEALA